MMHDTGQQPITPQHSIRALSEIISQPRLGTYLNAAGHDPDRALNLYLWNARVGEAFHLPVQAVEVGLRNRVSDGLAAKAGDHWWNNSEFIGSVEDRQKEDIDLALRRIKSKGKALETGQVVASLSFGFWVAMLHGRYNPDIWSAHLRTSFPHLPNGVTRGALYNDVQQILDLRNRLWHHEPIFKRNLSKDFSQCMKVVQWLCPTKAAWIRPHCRVQALLREKP